MFQNASLNPYISYNKSRTFISYTKDMILLFSLTFPVSEDYNMSAVDG